MMHQHVKITPEIRTLPKSVVCVFVCVFNIFLFCHYNDNKNDQYCLFVFLFVYAGIVYPPVSANVSVGQSAVFTCTAVADVIEWLADNEPVSDHKVHVKGFTAHTEPLNSTTGFRQSKLRVAGQEENDNVSITCVAFNNSNLLKIDKSDPALLRVQGIGTMIFTVFDMIHLLYRFVGLCR